MPLRPRRDPAIHAMLARIPPTPEGPLSYFNPADEPFIDYLVRKYSNKKDEELFDALARDFDEGAFQAKVRFKVEDASEIVREFLDPALFIEGRWVFDLRLRTLTTAMSYFTDKTPLFHEVPVVLLPSLELNGFAISSPLGRPAIVLNYALMSLGLLYTTIYQASGYAHARGELIDIVHSTRDYAETLILLAARAFTGDRKYAGLKTLGNVPLDIEWSVRATRAAQSFVLLHEYSHVASGDLQQQATHAAALGIDEAFFSRSSQAEIRADYHAAAALSAKNALEELGISRTEMAAAVIILFAFFGLCDYIKVQLFEIPSSQAHPPPELRTAAVLEAIEATGEKVDRDHIARLLLPFEDAFDRVDETLRMRGKVPQRAVTDIEALRQGIFGPSEDRSAVGASGASTSSPISRMHHVRSDAEERLAARLAEAKSLLPANAPFEKPNRSDPDSTVGDIDEPPVGGTPSAQHSKTSGLTMQALKPALERQLEQTSVSTEAGPDMALNREAIAREPAGLDEAQLKLAVRLLTAGMRQGGTALLEEACAAFRALLDSTSSTAAPLDWTKRRIGLGIALTEVGLREGATARLEEADRLLSETLSVLVETLDGEADANRGEMEAHLTFTAARARMAIGQRRQDPTFIRGARDALQWAVMKFEHAGRPEDAAGARLRLIEARAALAAFSGDQKLLREAALEVNEALAALPADTSWSQQLGQVSSLTDTFLKLADLEGGEEFAAAAVFAQRKLLRHFPREAQPLQWAAAQDGLGRALLALDKAQAREETLREAVAAFEAALEEVQRCSFPLAWAQSRKNLGKALGELGELRGEAELLRKGVSQLREALSVFKVEEIPADGIGTATALGEMLLTLAELENSLPRVEEAVSFLRDVVNRLPAHTPALLAATMFESLGLALVALGQFSGNAVMLQEGGAKLQAAIEGTPDDKLELLAGRWGRFGSVLEALAALEGGRTWLDLAATAQLNAARAYWQAGRPGAWLVHNLFFARVVQRIGLLEEGTQTLELAVDAVERGFERLGESVPEDMAAQMRTMAAELRVEIDRRQNRA